MTLDADHIARLDAVSAVPKVFPYDVLQGPAEAMLCGGVSVARR